VSSSASAVPADWTGPEEITGQLRKLWDRGDLLARPLAGEAIYPLPLRLKRPAPRDLPRYFDEVRAWIIRLEAHSRTRRGFGYEIAWEEIAHRQLGRNRLPKAVFIPAEDDALRLLGKRSEAETFCTLAEASMAAFPSLRTWILRKPLVLLAHADDWRRILDVLTWFQSHPRSGLYLRQIDIPGIGTKFIEARKGLLQELHDNVLAPSDSAEAGPAGQTFEQRYGLRGKPVTVRFRVLDPRLTIGGLSDIAVPARQFAALQIPAARVFITENEINGLCFPEVENSIVIFGLGYGIDILKTVPWLAVRDIIYWGDIDTHGLAMLGRLRAFLPQTKPLLMDRETLLAHRRFWVREDAPYGGMPEGLTAAERELFENLRFGRLGDRVRLEQERIGFGWLKRALGLDDCEPVQRQARNSETPSSRHIQPKS
jgi:hypothetical protein